MRGRIKKIKKYRAPGLGVWRRYGRSIATKLKRRQSQILKMVNVKKISNHRIRLAFLIAPMSPVLFFALMFGVSKSENIGVWPILIFFISLSVCYLATLCFGGPVVAFLRKIKKLNLIYLIVAGCFFGTISLYLASLCLAFSLESSVDPHANLEELIWGCVFGGAISLVFGLIAGLSWFGSAD